MLLHAVSFLAFYSASLHLNIVQMEAKNCKSCLRDDTNECAEYWCFDCDEPLCGTCLKNHKKNKFLMNHHVVDLDFIDIFPTSTLSSVSHCSKHGDGRADLYCSDHDILCCRHCMTESHRTCKSIVPIDIASRNVKESPLPKMLSHDVTVFLQSLNTMISNSDDAIKTFEKEKDDIRIQIQSLKQQWVDHLNRLEKTITENVQNCFDEQWKTLENEKEDLVKTRKSFQVSKTDLDVVLQHGSETQIFVFTNYLAHHLAKEEMLVQTNTGRFTDVTMKFTPEVGFEETIKSIGTLNIYKKPCATRSISLKRRRAQVISRDTETKTQFLYKSNIEITLSENIQITSIAVTSDDRIILCNRLCNRLLVYNESGKFLQDCTVLSKPWDIAILPDGNRAVVTLPLENSIQFITISNMIPDKDAISINNKCHGVTVVSDSIVVGANREVYILTLDGEIKTQVQVPGQLVYFLHPGNNDTIYYTDYHSVYHVSLNGDEIFRFEHPDLKVPEGIARDKQGYLCVVGRGSQNVHRIGNNGYAIDIVLSREDGVILPWAISFNNDFVKAFISTQDGKCISVYDIHTYICSKPGSS